MKVYEELNQRRYPTIDMEQTGKNIALLLDASDMTPDMLGQCLCFESGRAVYKWINGETLPTLDHFLSLSWLFRVPLEKLIFVKGISRPLAWSDFIPVQYTPALASSVKARFRSAAANLRVDSLRARLSEKNISLKTLSSYLGFTTSRSISRWMSRSVKPTLDNLVAVCSLLNTPMDELVSLDLPDRDEADTLKDREPPEVLCAECTDNFVYSADSNSSLEHV